MKTSSVKTGIQIFYWALVLSALFCFTFAGACAKSNTNDQQTATVKRGDVNLRLMYMGKLYARDYRIINLPVGANLEQIKVKSNQDVKKGAQLGVFSFLPGEVTMRSEMQRRISVIRMSLEESMGAVPLKIYATGQVDSIQAKVGSSLVKGSPLFKTKSADGSTKQIFSPFSGKLIRLYIKSGSMLPVNKDNIVGLVQTHPPDLTARGLGKLIKDTSITAEQRALAAEALSINTRLSSSASNFRKLGSNRFALTSPSPGKVLYINEQFAFGKTFDAQTVAFVVGNDDAMSLSFSIHERDLRKVKEGQAIKIIPAGFEDATHTGTIESVQRSPKPGTKGEQIVTYNATAVVENKDGGIIHGMSCRVSAQVETRKNVLTLPVSFVHGGDPWYVWLKEGDQSKKQSVKIGLTAGQVVEIKEGLSEGQHVVRKGL